MNKRYLHIGAGIAILVALLAVLNPSAEQHREGITEGYAERSALDKALGVGHLAAFVAKYHSLGVASYTTVNDDVVSVGVLGMVFFVE